MSGDVSHLMGVAVLNRVSACEDGHHRKSMTYDTAFGPVTLRDTNPMATTAFQECSVRGHIYRDRIARMRKEWIARGGQNA